MASKYAAFISYRHLPLDMAVAERLHQLIERYRIPKDLRKNGQKHLGRVFRDRDELPLSNDLTQDIYDALDGSEYLIVICTPDTPKSLWVRREIQHFISVHGRNRVLTVLAAGTMEESVPEEITAVYGEDGTVVDRIEPLCAFLVDENRDKVLHNLKSEFLRLVAAILGCPYDSIVQRQKRYWARLLTMAVGAVAAVAMVIIGLLVWWNLDVTAKNEEISGLNTQIQEQLRQTQLNESKALTLLSENQLEEGDRIGAIESALGALEGERPYYAPAEAALTSAVHAYEGSKYYEFASLKLDTHAYTVLLSDDGRYAVAVDENGTATCMDLTTGEVLWDDVKTGTFTERSRITGDNQRLITLRSDGGKVYDLLTGEAMATVPGESSAVISPDDSILITVKRYSGWNENATTVISVFDLSAGMERYEISLEMHYGFSSFSQDGRYLMLMPLAGSKFIGTETILIDCITGETTQILLPGICVASCPLPSGGFAVLSVEGEWDESGTYSYHKITEDGSVLQSYPAGSQNASAVRNLLADDDWLYCVGKYGYGMQIVSLHDGVMFDDSHASVDALMTSPDDHYLNDEEIPVAFFDSQGDLLVVNQKDEINRFYFSENLWSATSLGPLHYYEVEGLPWTALHQSQLYGESMIYSDAFVNTNSGKVIALVDKADEDRIVFLRQPEHQGEDISDRVSGGCTQENARAYVEALYPEKKLYCSFDAETGVLSWGETKERENSTQCPYTIQGKKPDVYKGGSGLIVLKSVPGDTTVPNGFAVYSTADDQWKWIDYAEEWGNTAAVAVGDSKNWVAILSDAVNTLRVYDIESGEVIYTGNLSLGSVHGAAFFVCQDRFMVFGESFEKSVAILNTETWQLMGPFDTSLTGYSFSAEDMAANVSPDGKRLYIGNLLGLQYGLVIDIESWTLLAKVPYMAGYDPEMDRLLCIDPNRQALIAWPIYEKDDFVAMGRDILAGN